MSQKLVLSMVLVVGSIGCDGSPTRPDCVSLTLDPSVWHMNVGETKTFVAQGGDGSFRFTVSHPDRVSVGNFHDYGGMRASVDITAVKAEGEGFPDSPFAPFATILSVSSCYDIEQIERAIIYIEP